MKRIIEKYICDCCGKEFDPYTNDTYKNEDPYAKKVSIRLPYFCDLPDKSDPNPQWTYNLITINDICDNCMKKLLNFTDELIPDNLKE